MGEKLVAAVPNLVPGEVSIEAWELERIHMKLMKEESHISLSDLLRITGPVLVMTSDEHELYNIQ